MEKLYILYKITNTQNNKSYIGYSDRTLPEVMNYFKWKARQGKEKLDIFNDMNENTFKYFRFEILRTINDKYLKTQLIYYIKQFRADTNGYNKPKREIPYRDKPKNLTFAGKKHTDETKEKIRNSMLGKNNINYGLKTTAKVKRIISENKLNVDRKEETKEKISNTLKEKYQKNILKKTVSEETKKKIGMKNSSPRDFNVELFNDVIKLKKRKIPNKDIFKIINITSSTLYRYLKKARKENLL